MIEARTVLTKRNRLGEWVLQVAVAPGREAMVGDGEQIVKSFLADKADVLEAGIYRFGNLVQIIVLRGIGPDTYKAFAQ